MLSKQLLHTDTFIHYPCHTTCHTPSHHTDKQCLHLNIDCTLCFVHKYDKESPGINKEYIWSGQIQCNKPFIFLLTVYLSVDALWHGLLAVEADIPSQLLDNFFVNF